ncbi:hypothetical protein RB2150_05773 [Rhodobacterales bacterium HTCC2150]|nr:hypothetical protein RB2150_05773 [Rhodobacterales bacterium HTCC2150] [Rhodobacteraceae bacterium HTCC2150]
MLNFASLEMALDDFKKFRATTSRIAFGKRMVFLSRFEKVLRYNVTIDNGNNDNKPK